MAGFATSRPASLALCGFLIFLNVFAFLLAVGAEQRRSTVRIPPPPPPSSVRAPRWLMMPFSLSQGKVVPDEYDERSYCLYDTDASTVYGVCAFFVLLLAQLLVSGVTRCLCFGPALSSRGCAVAAFAVSWLTFLVAEACLVGGSAKNAYHTKYLGYYTKHDLVSCAALRKGVFAAAAAMMLINLAASLVYYWSYSKAADGGFIKHQNEAGVGMTDYGLDRGGGPGL
ncbi:hypothetical protein CFC21_055569 [Triticum aestivum]|uniref:Fiber protein Fb34 n=2 Tax=Triticum aestivum TaxID=4565 RepID=A0A9R1GGC1_WHEAT|nr:hypothetical protein CFC21_055569 [Triticum aestivum]